MGCVAYIHVVVGWDIAGLMEEVENGGLLQQWSTKAHFVAVAGISVYIYIERERESRD